MAIALLQPLRSQELPDTHVIYRVIGLHRSTARTGLPPGQRLVGGVSPGFVSRCLLSCLPGVIEMSPSSLPTRHVTLLHAIAITMALFIIWMMQSDQELQSTPTLPTVTQPLQR